MSLSLHRKTHIYCVIWNRQQKNYNDRPYDFYAIGIQVLSNIANSP
jgi:hypothetical protein